MRGGCAVGLWGVVVLGVDGVVVGGEGVEFFGDGGEFAGDAGLFGFEQVEGDGPGVVGLEEFGLLGFECALLAGEVLGVLVGGGVKSVEFVVCSSMVRLSSGVMVMRR